jgi:hypothetical protein
LSKEAITLLFKYLPRSYLNGPNDYEAREKVGRANERRLGVVVGEQGGGVLGDGMSRQLRWCLSVGDVRLKNDALRCVGGLGLMV